jgi:D-alanine-D-alanine ligase
MQRKIAVLFGGESPEHEVSINSGINVIGGLERSSGNRVVPIYIGRDGLWHWPEELGQFSAEKRARAVPERRPDPLFRAAGPRLPAGAREAGGRSAEHDVHRAARGERRGRAAAGGAGDEQAALHGIGCAASSLAMDKPRCQAYLLRCSFPFRSS